MKKRVNIIFATCFYTLFGLVLLAMPHVANAEENGEVSLVFHMALSNQKLVEVHATVANTGSVPIDRGYIVVSGRDAQCKSSGDVLQPFSNIPVGGKIAVVITLTSGSSGYFVTSLQAFDDFDFPVATHDNTAEIIKGRLAGMRSECEKSRGVTSK